MLFLCMLSADHSAVNASFLKIPKQLATTCCCESNHHVIRLSVPFGHTTVMDRLTHSLPSELLCFSPNVMQEKLPIFRVRVRSGLGQFAEWSIQCVVQSSMVARFFLTRNEKGAVQGFFFFPRMSNVINKQKQSKLKEQFMNQKDYNDIWMTRWQAFK